MPNDTLKRKFNYIECPLEIRPNKVIVLQKAGNNKKQIIQIGKKLTPDYLDCLNNVIILN